MNMAIESMANAFSLKGKTAIVTGGSRGIGLGIATAMAQCGADVAIFARNEEAGQKVVREFQEKYDGKFAFYKTDITDTQSAVASVNACIRDFGSVDILVNNAGVGPMGGLLDQKEDLSGWLECFDVDLHGAVRMCYLVARHMRDTGKGGRIINITSNAGEIVNLPFITAYATAKAALNHFTRVVAAELAPLKIRVNAIAPGFTLTDFTNRIPPDALEPLFKSIPLGRFIDPIEIGALAVYLASDASEAVTGAVFTIDGGYSLLH